jgi:hypothetical protein
LFGAVAVVLLGVLGAPGADEVVPRKEQPKVAKLDVSRQSSLEKGDAWFVDLSAQPGAQLITVAFSSSQGPIRVYVVRDPDADDRADALPDPKKVLAEARAQAGVLKVDVPEKIATRILFRDATGKTAVELKLTNQLVPDAKDEIKKLQAENAALKAQLEALKSKQDKQ